MNNLFNAVARPLAEGFLQSWRDFRLVATGRPYTLLKQTQTGVKHD